VKGVAGLLARPRGPAAFKKVRDGFSTKDSWRMCPKGGQKSSPLSPHHRFVIALHSPDGVFETGLLICPPEKKAMKLAFVFEQGTFSSPF
jgi:hypothetical protein